MALLANMNSTPGGLDSLQAPLPTRLYPEIAHPLEKVKFETRPIRKNLPELFIKSWHQTSYIIGLKPII